MLTLSGVFENEAVDVVSDVQREGEETWEVA
jgi:hypothetical protein